MSGSKFDFSVTPGLAGWLAGWVWLCSAGAFAARRGARRSRTVCILFEHCARLQADIAYM